MLTNLFLTSSREDKLKTTMECRRMNPSDILKLIQEKINPAPIKKTFKVPDKDPLNKEDPTKLVPKPKPDPNVVPEKPKKNLTLDKPVPKKGVPPALPNDSGVLPDENIPMAPTPEEIENTKQSISNSYKMNKTYVKLRTLKTILEDLYIDDLNRIKFVVDESIVLFDSFIMPNYDLYTDSVDDIVELYIKLIKECVTKIEQALDARDKEDDRPSNSRKPTKYKKRNRKASASSKYKSVGKSGPNVYNEPKRPNNRKKTAPYNEPLEINQGD